MGALPNPEPIGIRHAGYVEEIHEFLRTSGVHYDAPEDLPTVVAKLQRPGTFADDMGSLIRSFILRQGGAMSHAELLDLISFAVGGSEVALHPQEYGESLRQLLSFIAGVQRRPWNVPPSVPGEVVPFPAEAVAPKRAVVEQPEAVPVPLPVADRLPVRDDLPATTRRRGGMWAAVAAAAVLAVGAVGYFSVHRTSSPPETFHVGPVPAAPLQAAPHPATTPNNPAVQAPAAGYSLTQQPPAVVNPAKPSAYGDRLSPRAAKGVVSQPYRAAIASTPSSPAPGQSTVSASPQVASVGSSPATVYSPYNPGSQTIQPQQTQPPAPIVRRPATVDPDNYLAGDMPSGAPSRPGQSYFTVSSGVMAANLISSVDPDYPLLARLAHVQGEVTLLAVVSKDGRVQVTRVLRGNRLLRSAAQDAVRQFRYRPYRIDGQPVEVATVVTVAFHDQD